MDPTARKGQRCPVCKKGAIVQRSDEANGRYLGSQHLQPRRSRTTRVRPHAVAAGRHHDPTQTNSRTLILGLLLSLVLLAVIFLVLTQVLPSRDLKTAAAALEDGSERHAGERFSLIRSIASAVISTEHQRPADHQFRAVQPGLAVPPVRTRVPHESIQAAMRRPGRRPRRCCRTSVPRANCVGHRALAYVSHGYNDTRLSMEAG